MVFFFNYQSALDALAKVSISILTKTLTFIEFDLLSFLNNKRNKYDFGPICILFQFSSKIMPRDTY